MSDPSLRSTPQDACDAPLSWSAFSEPTLGMFLSITNSGIDRLHCCSRHTARAQGFARVTRGVSRMEGAFTPSGAHDLGRKRRTTRLGVQCREDRKPDLSWCCAIRAVSWQ